MRRKLPIIRITSLAVSAFILTVLANWQGNVTLAESQGKSTMSAVCGGRLLDNVLSDSRHRRESVAHGDCDQTMPYVTPACGGSHHEATLTDASQTYRICSSRPQRITPSQGSKTERYVTPYSSFTRQHNVKHLYSFYDSRQRHETAPFCLSVSRDYYVIALRHIIR